MKLSYDIKGLATNTARDCCTAPAIAPPRCAPSRCAPKWGGDGLVRARGAARRSLLLDSLQRSPAESTNVGNKTLDDISARIAAAMKTSPVRDVEKNVRVVAAGALGRLDLVNARGIRDAGRSACAAREKLEALEARVAGETSPARRQRRSDRRSGTLARRAARKQWHAARRSAQPRIVRIRRAAGRPSRSISPADCRRSIWSACPRPKSRKAAIAFAPRCRTRSSIFRRAGSPSTSRRRICPRNPADSICRSRWAFSLPPGRSPPTRSADTNSPASSR